LHNEVTMFTIERSKKYKLVEFPRQKIYNLEEKKLESEQIFSILSIPNQEKYLRSYARFVELAKQKGFDRVENYDIFFTRFSPIFRSFAGYRYNADGENYIYFTTEFVSVSSEMLIIKTLFHELIGHCLSSKNQIKFSDKLRVNSSGLNISRRRNDVNIEATEAMLTEIVKNLENGENGKNLSSEQTMILLNFSTNTGSNDYLALAKKLLEYYRTNNKNGKVKLPLGSNIRSIGTDLNEAITEILAIRFTTDDVQLQSELLSQSPDYKFILPLLTIKAYLECIEGGISSSWEDCLLQARLKSEPYKIIKFLKDKTGISITPNELFALDFRKILGSRATIPNIDKDAQD
jgi:hypothetical protein